MSTTPALAGDRKLAGQVVDDATNFRFEVWAYRTLTEEELSMTYTLWNRQRDRRKKLRNQLIQVIANHGCKPGL